MSGVDDLKAAVASTATNLTTVSTDLGAVSGKIDTAIALIQSLRQSGGLSDADAEQLAQTLQGANTQVSAAQASLDAEADKLAGA